MAMRNIRHIDGGTLRFAHCLPVGVKGAWVIAITNAWILPCSMQNNIPNWFKPAMEVVSLNEWWQHRTPFCSSVLRGSIARYQWGVKSTEHRKAARRTKDSCGAKPPHESSLNEARAHRASIIYRP